MLDFTKPLKIYLFKDRNIVNFNIKVTNNMVNAYTFTIADFENLLNNWQTAGGLELKINNDHWHIQWKKKGPRPRRETADYVKISVSVNTGQTFHYRVDFTDMYEMEQEYFYQKNNKMYWD